MITSLTKLSICPNCGSTQYLADYPAVGQKTCTKCSHPSTDVELKPLKNSDDPLENCPFCGKEGGDDDTLFENNHVLIYKCKQCGKLDGYKFLDDEEETDWDPEELNDEDRNPLQVKIARKEGHFILPASKYKEIAKALQQKEKNPKEKCKRQLHQLVRQNNEALKTAGVSPKLIEDATYHVERYINEKGELTEKQLKNLFCASIYVFHDAMIRSGRITATNLTERSLHEIFDVDRKTIRKWKNIVKERLSPLKLRVTTHKGNNLNPDTLIELPKELKSIIKLENPYNGKCDHSKFEKNEDLTHQITYSDGSWSDICQSCSNWTKLAVCERDWTRKFPPEQ